ncbi:O-antigen polysaccharide polymerase Wzy [Actinophytocola xanthii]|uniref:Polysaccharide polymerase n=1 Tax=Actinophytocola xanthii TaxID=1912961 RepID=A0A1Q8BWU5_9PSEU|nr:O-antigen polysaccharide polymerase Wzy [Actinophytocola xanthii]OLF06593.1 hypothetical protein BU204_36270 [Actinophytocola xanthii]
MWWALVLNLAGSLVMLGWMFRRGGTRNVLLGVGVVFAFMAYGPLVNLILGESTYGGIVIAHLPAASTGFLLALVGLAFADLLQPQRQVRVPATSPRTYELLPIILAGLAGYAAVRILTLGPAMLGADKLTRIELAGRWHYPYLLAETFAVALYFVARRTAFYRALYWLNAAAYVAYCLVTTERDFLFVGLAVLVHVQVFDPSMRSRRLVVLGVASVALAAFLAALRENLTFGLAQALNQGSIPFVDTFVRLVVPDFWPYRFGESYLEALNPRGELLQTWLVNLYAAGSSGGYGFSLTAEAYLNFGTLGVPVVFVALGLLVRWTVNQAGRSEWTTYLSVLLLTAVLTTLRGESAQLVRMMGYGVVFFAVVWLGSSRSRTPTGVAHGMLSRGAMSVHDRV